MSILVLSLFVYCWKKLNLQKELGETHRSLTKKGLGVFVAFIALLSVSFLLYLSNPTAVEGSEKLSTIITTNTFMFAFYLVRTILIVPIYEEVLFRGVVLGLEKKWLSVVRLDRMKKQFLFAGGIFLNSLVFAYLHHSNSMTSFLVFLFFGIISSCLVVYTNDLTCSIFLHQLNNLFSILSIL